MIRFRNPVSDINIIINVFKKLYSEFSNAEYFDLDNIAEFLARENLASSSGYIGNEALRRSYQIKDDARKSMKMQAKSYSEIYRLLGWLHSNENSQLKFHFTYLGVHVALSGKASKDLFEECLLGVIYPNENLNVKFNDINKPFVSMIKVAGSLEGHICRDEILLSAMNLKNGKSEKEFIEKINFIKELRKSKNIANLNAAINKLSFKLDMQPNSLRNLTRFVISSLDYTGWFNKVKLEIYGKKTNFLKLTDKGWAIYNRIKSSLDLYKEDILKFNDSISEVADLSFFEMLKNADFDVQTELDNHSNLVKKIKLDYDKDSILFSPFQCFSTKNIKKYMPNKVIITKDNIVDVNINFENIDDRKLFKSNKAIDYLKIEDLRESVIKEVIHKYYTDGKNINESIDNFMSDIRVLKQSEFYPLIANLLSFVFDREAINPSAGNNNLRFDALIEDDESSVPCEVKSPTEEEMLSVKAIRQALENKIVLLSRKHYPVTFKMSSLAIGYSTPNKRSDVYRLIEDIYNTYKINIAVTDAKELFKAALYCFTNKTKFNLENLNGYRGRIEFNYEDI